ncbi:trypsin-1-like [Babylonia areolata]|uniref:trypsin-1-like n=1 Tax=Babylonia areolata TaxID=304850 RepID=UPI003FCF7E05
MRLLGLLTLAALVSLLHGFQDTTQLYIPDKKMTTAVGEDTGTSSNNPNEGMSKEMESAGLAPTVVNGQGTYLGQHPFICSLQVSFQGFWFFICASVIVNENTLITAAHCVDFDPPLPTRVVCGEYNLLRFDGTEVIKKIVEIRQHPNFTLNPDEGFPNDLALLKPETPLEFNRFVNVLAIHNGVARMPRFCLVIGWGQNEEGVIPNILKQGVMKRVSNRKCAEYYATPFAPKPVGSGHICASGKRTNVSACFGDSGGPLVCGTYLVGITSWGPRTCNPRFPNGFTRLSFYQCWITENSFGDVIGQ